jgi:hypothetical protein
VGGTGQCQAIRADLVREVTVPCDPVGAQEHQLYLAARDEPGRGAVDDHFDRDSLGAELERRQPHTLQQRPGLASQDTEPDARAPGREQHRERRAFSGGREASRVAVREDHGTWFHEHLAELADALAAVDVLRVDRPGLAVEPLQLRLGEHRAQAAIESSLQVDGRGPRRTEPSRHVARPVGERRGQRRHAPHAEQQTVCGHDADRGGAAHAQAHDCVDRLLDGVDAQHVTIVRQPRLVEHFEVALLVAAPGNRRRQSKKRCRHGGVGSAGISRKSARAPRGPWRAFSRARRRAPLRASS